MAEFNTRTYLQALSDFRRARFKANMEQMVGRLTGKSTGLLPYEEVRRRLKAESTSKRTLKDIPLDAIVGSVGRYADFTRSYHPLQNSDQTRWARIETKMVDLIGLPPIEVYQVGEVYFVIDGNHRVSVAREMGATHIEAYVTEVQSKVPLTPDINPDDIILKERYLKFLERTRLDELRPGVDLTVSVPGQYRVLEEHIELHRYFMGLEQQREIPYEEAVLNWYDEDYSVVVEAIREHNIMQEFPGWTETDLYLWVSGYRVFLEEDLGWRVAPEDRAEPLAGAVSGFQGSMARVINKLADGLTLPEGEPKLLPGEWRREHLLNLFKAQSGQPFRLFTNILVPVDGREQGWFALNQALGVARREGGRLLGLHVVPAETDAESPAVQQIKAKFNRRCARAGIPGQLAVEVGNVADKISDRARWADLVVIRLVYPPAAQPIARLGSGLRAIIRQAHCPLLFVPRDFAYPLDRALLAYDGSPKAQEALYIAAYLASRWRIPLVVVTVLNGRVTAATGERARDYLHAHRVEAVFVQRTGAVAEAILAASEENDSSLIIMGGYGYNPVMELVLGSAVDEVLRSSRRPTLICG